MSFGLFAVPTALAANGLSCNERNVPHMAAFRKLTSQGIQRRRDKWRLTTSPAPRTNDVVHASVFHQTNVSPTPSALQIVFTGQQPRTSGILLAPCRPLHCRNPTSRQLLAEPMANPTDLTLAPPWRIRAFRKFDSTCDIRNCATLKPRRSQEWFGRGASPCRTKGRYGQIGGVGGPPPITGYLSTGPPDVQRRTQIR
jgi:hypothetical protein